MKIFVVGISGRMGRAICKQAKRQKKIQIVGGLSRKENVKKNLVTRIGDTKKKFDVVVDFSSPEMFRETLSWCTKNKVPILSGTTGLTSADFKKIKSAGKKIPILWTANTSIGVQLLKEMLKAITVPANYDVLMTEWHHIHKKDKPSGTAKVLNSLLKTQQKNKSKIVSIRKGQIIGVHKIVIESTNETLAFLHKAKKREVFAEGALQIAEWLGKQKKSLYSMEDFVASFKGGTKGLNSAKG